MKKINVETLVPSNFKFIARDLDGKIFAFENKPELATDIACDTWDVKEGEILQVTYPVENITTTSTLLGDWRESLTELS
jgi:hypothetical protein|tara:strand:+ start:79 stop:315 length:237 start_codon:yes stop_codon:yes gene_type:complete